MFQKLGNTCAKKLKLVIIAIIPRSKCKNLSRKPNRSRVQLSSTERSRLHQWTLSTCGNSHVSDGIYTPKKTVYWRLQITIKIFFYSYLCLLLYTSCSRRQKVQHFETEEDQTHLSEFRTSDLSKSVSSPTSSTLGVDSKREFCRVCEKKDESIATTQEV